VTLSRVRLFRVIASMDRDLELQLVERLRRRDAVAFEAVHDAFNTRLYNFLARLANSRDVAEDLLEETWLRLVVHAPRLRPDTSLAAWLFTVARNLHASYRRSRNIEDAGAVDAIGLWMITPEASPLEVAEASETERRIGAALASLPPTYREALLLVSVEGLRPSEAATICGVTPEAMRQRLSRARALLDRRLTQTEGPGLRCLNEVIL
jgi:RNA polymerase sigma-70 factor (ECF subfamily)